MIKSKAIAVLLSALALGCTSDGGPAGGVAEPVVQTQNNWEPEGHGYGQESCNQVLDWIQAHVDAKLAEGDPLHDIYSIETINYFSAEQFTNIYRMKIKQQSIEMVQQFDVCYWYHFDFIY